MALPTIHHSYIPAASGSSDLVDFMSALQAQLLAAGWTIEYADADAIGGGSAGAPAWDKTPAANTSAGVAVYRMPANDHTTQWFVRIAPGWAASTSRPGVGSLTIGDTHDGSGTVTGGPAEMTVTLPTSGVQTGLEVGVSASEDGFMLAMGGTNGTIVLVERVRTWAGTVTDDLIAFLGISQASFAHARAGVGTVTTQPPIVLAGMSATSPTHFGSGNLLVNGDGDEIPIVGPFWPGADPFYGPPRVAFLGPANDYTGLSSYDRVVDGGSKTYLALNSTAAASWARWMLATE